MTPFPLFGLTSSFGGKVERAIWEQVIGKEKFKLLHPLTSLLLFYCSSASGMCSSFKGPPLSHFVLSQEIVAGQKAVQNRRSSYPRLRSVLRFLMMSLSHISSFAVTLCTVSSYRTGSLFAYAYKWCFGTFLSEAAHKGRYSASWGILPTTPRLY